jgi:hypothetical protein
VLTGSAGRVWRVTVQSQGKSPFDDLGNRGAEVALVRWIEDAFAPWGTGSRSLGAALLEMVTALNGRAPELGSEGDDGATWGERVDFVRHALERGLRNGYLRCEPIRVGSAIDDDDDDGPDTVRQSPPDAESP